MSAPESLAASPLDPPVLIRPALIHEARAVALTHVRADRETYQPIFGDAFRKVAFERSLQRWQTALAAGEALLVAEQSGRIVGFTHAADAWMSALYLLATHRRRGIGSRLLGGLRTELKARGVSEIGFQAVADNAGAIAFYHACGARQVGRKSESDAESSWEEIVFVLRL
jgi:ribosomal protein S18 acetylase RimI-like enzyme